MDILRFLRKGRVHLTQLDPEKEEKNTPQLLEMISNSGTDGIIIAGSTNVNSENLLKLLYDCKRIDLPKIVAPSSPEMVPPEVCKKILPCYTSEPLADYMLVYDVINAEDPAFITGKHKEWYKMFYNAGIEPPSRSCCEEMAYIPCSHSGTVIKVVPIDPDFRTDNIVGLMMVGARRHPIVYLETTGLDVKLTGIKVSEYVREGRKFTSLSGFKDLIIISGGGIRSEEEARERLEAGANAINVGDPLYFDDQPYGHAIYLSTIRGAKPEIRKEYHEKLYEEIYHMKLPSNLVSFKIE
jgi:geranylgeranylglyceryl phosphate synthase family protein